MDEFIDEVAVLELFLKLYPISLPTDHPLHRAITAAAIASEQAARKEAENARRTAPEPSPVELECYHACCSAHGTHCCEKAGKDPTGS